MLVTKLLFNSVISTKGAQFMTINIFDFYLMTLLKRPEFIRISINDIPEEIIIEYKLREIADSKGMIYIEANQGMYGLPQSRLLANELLEKRLNKGAITKASQYQNSGATNGAQSSSHWSSTTSG